LPRDIGFQEIYHLGFSSQPSIFTKSRFENLHQNLMLLPSLLKKCDENGTIIYASSSEVYNGCKDLPCSESHIGDLKNENRRDYMLSKLTSERYLELASEFNMRVLNLRISLVYGPQVRKDDSRVLYKFLNDAFTKGRITIEGNSNSLRSYLFVDDFLDALFKLTQVETSGTFNFASTEQVSILTLANKLSEITGVPLEERPGLVAQGAPDAVQVDSGKLIDLIGVFQKTSLESGLQKTANWFKQTYF